MRFFPEAFCIVVLVGFLVWKYRCRDRRVLRALWHRSWSLDHGDPDSIRCRKYILQLHGLALTVYRRTVPITTPAIIVRFTRDPATTWWLRWFRPTASRLFLLARHQQQLLRGSQG